MSASIVEEIQMRFWGKDQKQGNRKNIWIEHLNIDTGNWFQVFSACLGKMIAIQTACLAVDRLKLAMPVLILFFSNLQIRTYH